MEELWLEDPEKKTVLQDDGAPVILYLKTDGEETGIRLRAEVKWDGCIHFYNEGDGSGENVQYLHICDLDEFIGELQALSKKAKEKFLETGSIWPPTFGHQ